MKKKIALFMAATMALQVVPMDVFASSTNRVDFVYGGTNESYKAIAEGTNDGLVSLNIEMTSDTPDITFQVEVNKGKWDPEMIKGPSGDTAYADLSTVKTLLSSALGTLKSLKSAVVNNSGPLSSPDNDSMINGIKDKEASTTKGADKATTLAAGESGGVATALTSGATALTDAATMFSDPAGKDESAVDTEITKVEGAISGIDTEIGKTATATFTESFVDLTGTGGATINTVEISDTIMKISLSSLAIDDIITIPLDVIPSGTSPVTVNVTNSGSSAGVTNSSNIKVTKGAKASVSLKSDDRGMITIKEGLFGSITTESKDLKISIVGSKAEFRIGSNISATSKEIELQENTFTLTEDDERTITISTNELIAFPSQDFPGSIDLDLTSVIIVKDRDYTGTIQVYVEGLGLAKEKVTVYDGSESVAEVKLEVEESLEQLESGRVEIEGNTITLTETAIGGFDDRYLKLELDDGLEWSTDEDNNVLTTVRLNDTLVDVNFDLDSSEVLYIDKGSFTFNEDEDGDKNVMEITPIVDVSADVRGEVKVTIKGPGANFLGNRPEVTAIVGDFKMPISINTKITSIKAGQAANKASKITFKESYEGALTAGNYYVSIETGILNTQSIKLSGVDEYDTVDKASGLEVTNIMLDKLDYEDKSGNIYTKQIIRFTVAAESEFVPGEFSLDGITVYADGTVPTSKSVYTLTVESEEKTSENSLSKGASVGYLVVSNLVDDVVDINQLNKDVVFTINSNSVSIDGKLGGQVPAPFININGSTMIPVRGLSEALGLRESDIIWNSIDRSVTLFIAKDKVVRFVSGTSEVLINGVSVPLVNPQSGALDRAENIGGRTYLPLRFISERVFDVEVEWNAVSRTATFNPSR